MNIIFQACQNNTYGPGCVYNCGSCANETACDTVDGVCADGCAPGWLLSNCSQGKHVVEL